MRSTRFMHHRITALNANTLALTSQGASINFSNCSCDFAGILYFPTAQVDYNSTGRSYQLLIYGQVNFSTSKLRLGNPRA